MVSNSTIPCSASGAKVKIVAKNALVSDSNDWALVTQVASDTIVNTVQNMLVIVVTRGIMKTFGTLSRKEEFGQWLSQAQDEPS